MHRKIICLIIAICIIVGGIICARLILQRQLTPEPPAPVLKLVEDCRTPLYIPHYLATELGFFAEQNLQVQLTTLDSGDKAHHLLHNKKAHIILAGPAQALLAEAILEAEPLVICAGIAHKSDSFLLAREQGDDFHWDNVRGRTIICGAATEDDSMILEHILRRHDIAPNWHCNIIANLPPALRPGAFKAGTGSFLVANGLVTEELVQQQAAVPVTPLAAEIGPLPAAAYITTSHYLDNNDEEIQALINGLHKAQQWMKYHSTAEVVKLVEKYFPDYNSTLLTTVVNRYKELGIWSASPVIDKEHYQNMVNIVADAGELVKDVPYNKGVNNRYAQRATKMIRYQPEPPKPQPGLNWPYIKSLFS